MRTVDAVMTHVSADRRILRYALSQRNLRERIASVLDVIEAEEHPYDGKTPLAALHAAKEAACACPRENLGADLLQAICEYHRRFSDFAVEKFWTTLHAYTFCGAEGDQMAILMYGASGACKGTLVRGLEDILGCRAIYNFPLEDTFKLSKLTTGEVLKKHKVFFLAPLRWKKLKIQKVSKKLIGEGRGV